MRSFFKYLIAFIFLFYANLVCENKIVNLDEAIKLSEDNNHDYKTQEFKVKEAEAKYNFQLGMLLPQFDADITMTTYEYNPSTLATLYGNQPANYYGEIYFTQVLFSGGKFLAELSSASSALESEKQKLEIIKKTVVLNVKNAYYQQLLSQLSYKIQIELLGKLNEQEQISLLLYNSGKIASVDLLNIQTQIASSEDTLNNLKNMIDVTAYSLGQAIGINEPYSAKQEIPEIDGNLKISGENERELLKDSPEIMSARKNLEQSKYDLDAINANYWPSLYLKADYNFTNDQLLPANPNWFVNLTLSIPIFHGGSQDAQSAEYSDLVKESEQSLEQTEINLYLQYKSARVLFFDKVARLKTTKTVLDLAKESLTASELKYNAGNLSAFDLINAETIYFNAQLNYYSISIDYWLALAQVEEICPNAIIKENKK